MISRREFTLALGAGSALLARGCRPDAPAEPAPPAPPACAVDVRDFGAAGDGRRDDAASIRAAERSLGAEGGVLFFPAGTYRLGGPLLFRSFQEWRFAPGAVLRLAPGAVDALRTRHLGRALVGIVQPAAREVQGVRFTGLTIDGARDANPTRDAGDGLNLFAVRDTLVDGAVITGCPRDGIVVGGGSRGVHLRGVRVESNGLRGVNGGNGIAIVQGEDITVAGFQASGNRLFGVNCETNPGAAAGAVRRVLIADGTAADTAAGPGVSVVPSLRAAAGSISDVLVVRVRASGNRTRGFHLLGQPGTGTSGLRLVDCEASGNGEEGFYTSDNTGTLLSACVARGNSRSRPGAFSGFRVHGSGNVVDRCVAESPRGAPAHAAGFDEAPGSAGNVFVQVRAAGGSGPAVRLVSPASVRVGA